MHTHAWKWIGRACLFRGPNPFQVLRGSLSGSKPLEAKIEFRTEKQLSVLLVWARSGKEEKIICFSIFVGAFGDVCEREFWVGSGYLRVT